MFFLSIHSTPTFDAPAFQWSDARQFQVPCAAARRVKRETGASCCPRQVRCCPRNGKRANPSRYHCAQAWEGEGFMPLASPETGLELHLATRGGRAQAGIRARACLHGSPLRVFHRDPFIPAAVERHVPYVQASPPGGLPGRRPAGAG
ncbi:hypothetical protein METHP14_60093 [Pseudomonas sp. P14-2025]